MARELNRFSPQDGDGETDGFVGSSIGEELLECHSPGKSRIVDRLLGDRQHQHRIERIARKNTKGTSVSWEDAVQAAQMKVFQEARAGKFARGSVEQFYRWATVVAKFAILDLVRQEKQQQWRSLDLPLPGTDVLLADTIADEFDLLDAVERADLVLRAIEAIRMLDGRYPQRGYLKLWQGKVGGKTQTQLAADLGITQGAVSKRWGELMARLARVLERFPEEICVESKLRTRSTQHWRWNGNGRTCCPLGNDSVWVPKGERRT